MSLSYVAISDAEIAQDKPVTNSLITRLRDNALAGDNPMEENRGIIWKDTTGSGTWTCPRSGWYEIIVQAAGGASGALSNTGALYRCAGGGGGGGAIVARVKVDNLDEWDADITTAPGYLIFSDGTKIIKCQAGADGADGGSGASAVAGGDGGLDNTVTNILYFFEIEGGNGGDGRIFRDTYITGINFTAESYTTTSDRMVTSGHGGNSFLGGMSRGVTAAMSPGSEGIAGKNYGGGGVGAAAYDHGTAVGSSAGGSQIVIVRAV